MTPGWASPRSLPSSPRAEARYFLPPSPPQNSTLTIEEFHSKLQEATNFPLRPFVIPFLKVGTNPLPLCWGPRSPESFLASSDQPLFSRL